MIYNQTEYNTHWDTKKLSDLGTFSRGKSKHRPRNDKKLFEGGGYPLIQTGEVKKANLFIDSHDSEYNEFGLAQSKLWDAGTLCITIAANIAETAILKYPMCFPDSVVGFNAYEDMTNEVFMHYIFSYIRQSIQKSVIGSIQDNINIDYLENLDFKIPSKEYQEKMLSVLLALDKRIELNNKMIEKLQTIVKTTFDFWFVQYDFPNQEGLPYKSSGGKMKYDKTLKKDIPCEWESGVLSDIADITMWQSPVGTSYNEIGEGSIFYQGSTDFGNRFPEPRVYTTQPNRMANAKDILMSVRAPVGTLNVTLDECCIGRGLAALKSKNDSQLYLFSLLDNFRLLFEKMDSNGTTFGSIGKDELFGLKVAIPKSELVAAFEEKVKWADKKIIECEKENRSLFKIRDWLLPLLMNGQVVVD